MKYVADSATAAAPKPAHGITPASPQPINVESAVCERTANPSIRLTAREMIQGEILLSIEQARALSLALIAAVNRHEQHAHARRKQAHLTVAPQPAER